jgi:hypothetical protein
MEGVCFLESNEEAMSFATLNLKGILNVYKVKNPDYAGIDTCTLAWTTSVLDILRRQTNQAQLVDSSQSKQVFISKFIIDLFIIGQLTNLINNRESAGVIRRRDNDIPE